MPRRQASRSATSRSGSASDYSGSDYSRGARDSYGSGSEFSGDSYEDVNVYGRTGPAWNERRRRHAADELGEEEHEQFDFDRERRFGQRTGGIQPHKGLYGHKSPSVASLVSTNTSFDAHEDGLKFGMMETAGGQEPFRMTVVHSKILVLISKYGQISVNDEPETWIRELPLQVLVYEGITAGVFEMDYSPVCMTISHGGVTRRMFLNLSQDAKSCIDELRENHLVSALKITSEDFQSVTALQVSDLGLKFLKTLPNTIFEEIDSYVYAPNAPRYSTELLHSSFDGDKFVLTTKSGFQRNSTVSEIEDVSYVSSPFLPGNIRTPWGKAMSSNAHRAHESAVGNSNLKDELSEAIRLSNVNVLVGEWVPFGSNNLVSLNERLGSLDRCQGGLFTALVDKTPLNTNFKVPTGLTSVRVLDFDMVHFANLEAEINFPEESGIVQVEAFGVHMNMDGTVFNGLKIEAIMDRMANNVSIDLLARVLVDVQLDSSKILDDLLSGYQRGLLDMIFLGDASNRNKYNVVVSDAIHPKLPAKKYLDRGVFENELKQVLGEIYAAEDLSGEDIIIIGKDGILMSGPNAPGLEAFLLYFTSLLCREVFIRNYFQRTFVLTDTLAKIRQLALQYQQDPDNISRLQMAISEASRDLIMLEETLSYLAESLEDMLVPEEPHDARGKKLFDVLNCKGMSHSIKMRVDDMTKLISGAGNQLRNLQQNAAIITTTQLENVFRNIDSNTKFLVDASSANERSSSSLAVMQVVLAGGFCFQVVDRMAGGTFNIAQPAWVYVWVYEPLIARTMGLWFLFNMIWLFVCGYSLLRLMRFLEFASSGSLSLRVKLNKKIHLEGLHTYFSTRYVDLIDSDVEPHTSYKEVEWEEDDNDDNEEKWLGSIPRIEMTYDYKHRFLLKVTLSVDKKESFATEEDLVKIFLQDLVMAGAMDREVAFGPDVEEGEIERALEAARLGQTAGRQAQQNKGFFGFFKSKAATEET